MEGNKIRPNEDKAHFNPLITIYHHGMAWARLPGRPLPWHFDLYSGIIRISEYYLY